MDKHELIYQIGTLKLKDLVPITSVRTDEDIYFYKNKGYSVVKINEFMTHESLLPHLAHLYYQNEFGFGEILYYNPKELELFSIGLYCDTEIKEFNSDSGKLIDEFKLKNKKLIESGEIGLFVVRLPESYRMEFICKNLQYIPDNLQYEAFLSAYTSTDYGAIYINENVLKKIVKQKTKEKKENTLKTIINFPDTIHIYRGIGDKSQKNGFSYTLDPNVARFFAFRHSIHADEVCIIEGDVQKEQIIEYIDNRGEKEVIVLPDTVLNKQIAYYYGLEDMLCTYSKVISIYQKQKVYLEKYLKTNPIIGGEHDQNHLLRVLILCIFLAEHYNIKKTYRKYLYNAAMFHDIGRINQDEDVEHGLLIYQALCKYDKKYESSLLKRLMEYHCKDDDLTIFTDDEQILYKILKDADALDRQRFGLRELDESYLRLDFSKELLFTAFQLTKTKL